MKTFKNKGVNMVKKNILLIVAGLVMYSATSLANVNLPNIQIRLIDTQGAPVNGITLRFWYRYEAWGLSCRKAIPALCPGYKSKGLVPSEMPSGETRENGIASILGTSLPFGPTAKDAELEIDGSDGYNTISFLECVPSVEIFNANTGLRFSGEKIIENIPRKITCKVGVSR